MYSAEPSFCDDASRSTKRAEIAIVLRYQQRNFLLFGEFWVLRKLVQWQLAGLNPFFDRRNLHLIEE